MKFKKEKIPIRWYKSEHEVDAYACRGLMVHKIPTDDTKYVWTISHVKTGLGIGLRYPPFRTMKEAKEMVVELLAENDWEVDPNDDKELDRLLKVLVNAWDKLYGIKWVTGGSAAVVDNRHKPFNCIQCGSESQRYALGEHNGKYGWYTWCLKCFPYDDRIGRNKEGRFPGW